MEKGEQKKAPTGISVSSYLPQFLSVRSSHLRSDTPVSATTNCTTLTAKIEHPHCYTLLPPPPLPCSNTAGAVLPTAAWALEISEHEDTTYIPPDTRFSQHVQMLENCDSLGCVTQKLPSTTAEWTLLLILCSIASEIIVTNFSYCSIFSAGG